MHHGLWVCLFFKVTHCFKSYADKMYSQNPKSHVLSLKAGSHVIFLIPHQITNFAGFGTFQ